MTSGLVAKIGVMFKSDFVVAAVLKTGAGGADRIGAAAGKQTGQRKRSTERLLERAKAALHEDDYRKMKATVDALSYLTELVADVPPTITPGRNLLR